MLYLHDENMNIYKAAAITGPKFYSNTRWTTSIKFIDGESITFHYVKGSGTLFYFIYHDKWHKMLRPVINNEDFPDNFIIVK